MSTPAQQRAEAARRLLELRDAEESFLGFVKLHHPEWKIPKFHLELIDKLDKLGKRILLHSVPGSKAKAKTIRNVLVTMPPRHSKSTICTVLWPAWMMSRNPRRFIMTCSYNAMLASDFGRQVRDLVADPQTNQAFPGVALAQDSRAVDVWRTESGGAYYGVGLGGTTTGRAANILIIDDPIKAREEAESTTHRNKVWDYYTAALSTRLQPEDNGAEPLQLVILTRWHPDDLAGRIMRTADWKEGRWLHINYQAITGRKTITPAAFLPEDDPMKVPTGTVGAPRRMVTEERALWPERFPLEELKRRERINPRDFASLYQQSPYIEGGNILKTEWWRFYPKDLNPNHFQSLIITADTAFKKDNNADYSVMCVAGISHDGDIYIVDMIRGRWDFPDLRSRLIHLNAQWRGKGLRAIYVEDRASGQSIIQELRRESGMSVIPYKVHRDKVSRVSAITPLIEGGRVYLPEASPWIDDFINECVSFPSGMNDDQVDAFTMAVDILSRQSVTPETLFGSLDASNSLNRQMVSRNPGMAKPLVTNPGGFRWGE